MSEKKRFRVGEAVVNLCSMKLDLAEQVVAHAEVAQREQMLEMNVAQDLKARLTKSMPDYVWQVFVGRNFGAYVTAEDGKYIYFYINQVRFDVRKLWVWSERKGVPRFRVFERSN
jgi:dynein light chain LC8-type